MLPKIRMIGKWGEYRVGEVIAPPGSLRKVLFDLKVAEFVEKPAPYAQVELGRERVAEAKKTNGKRRR